MSSFASAKPGQIDYGKRSSMEGAKSDLNTDIQTPQMNTSLNGNRLQLVEWHTNFNALGQKRSDLQGKSAELNGGAFDYELMESDVKANTMASGNRKMARLRNWNYMKENVMAGKYMGSEITSPVGRQMQQMIDEASLRDLNRFSFPRNLTDEGIPAKRAGEGDLEGIPMQFQRQERSEDDYDFGFGSGAQPIIRPSGEDE